MIRGVASWAKKFLGEHKDEQGWDFREIASDEEAAAEEVILLIPLRYAFLCPGKIMSINLLRISQAKNESNNFSPFYFAGDIMTIIYLSIKIMPTPKIEFCDSWVYDDQWRYFYTELGKEYPPYEKLGAKVRRIERAWQKDGEAILREMEKLSGLRWQEKKIQCFVVGRMTPFSYPLTIMVYEDKPIDCALDVLTHELVHQLFVQNDSGGAYKAWAYIHRRYRDEEFNTRIHVPVHAIHHEILLKFFGPKRLQGEIDSMKGYPDYERAWEIVLQAGAENILTEFKKRL